MIGHLVIGGDGILGSALRAEFARRGLPCAHTTRRTHGDSYFYDLLASDPADLPDADVVYLVAAVARIWECEIDPATWRANVDAQVALARRFSRFGGFVVFVSSDAAERGSTQYGQQKRQVEGYINAIDGAVVRPSRFDRSTAPALARLVVSLGVDRRAGLTRWLPSEAPALREVS